MKFLGLSRLNVSHFPRRAWLGIAEASLLSCTQQADSAAQVTGHLVPRLLRELQMAPGDSSGLVGFVLASSKHPRAQQEKGKLFKGCLQQGLQEFPPAWHPAGSPAALEVQRSMYPAAGFWGWPAEQGTAPSATAGCLVLTATSRNPGRQN